MKKEVKKKLFTVKEIDNGSDFPLFSSEKDRLRYMKDNYSGYSVAESFIKYLGLESDKMLGGLALMPDTVSSNLLEDTIITITVSRVEDGKVYCDNSPYKESIYISDDLLSHEKSFRHYLVDHENKVDVLVKHVKDGIITCSIKDACIRHWEQDIDDAIKTQKAIQVHIDRLFKSGYICSTIVHTLYEVLGIEKREMVFIPGSLIVVNIERDFEKWVDQDVLAIPQNITTFKESSETKPIRSIVCSRKAALQQQSWVNLYNIFNRAKLADKFGSDSYGVFTGEVSGKINTSNKTGIFVEIDEQYITGLYSCDEETYKNYNIGDKVNVEIIEFEKKDGVKDEFVIYNNKIVKCNIRPILKIVK